jgi:ankyrin repeat protein
MQPRWFCVRLLLVLPVVLLAPNVPTFAQTPPTSQEASNYRGLLHAAHRNDPKQTEQLLAANSNCDVRDGYGRTSIHVAAHASAYAAFEALSRGGCDVRAQDQQQYDAITIAAVANDVRMLKLAIKLGGDPKAVTSPYEGTALIAAAHLGHVEVVKALIEAGAPLDHINNLGWTALIEAIVLGNGEKPHVDTVRALVAGGADQSIRDRNGMTPRQLADQRDFSEISKLLKP